MYPLLGVPSSLYHDVAVRLDTGVVDKVVNWPQSAMLADWANKAVFLARALRLVTAPRPD